MPSARERGLSHPNLMLDVGYERVRGAISNIQLAMISGGVKNYRKRNSGADKQKNCSLFDKSTKIGIHVILIELK